MYLKIKRHEIPLFPLLVCALGHRLGQQYVLLLELSADGAGDEAVVLVNIATQPGLSDAPMTVTLMGDDEVMLTIALPNGTMQGVVTASATDCTGNFIEEEAFIMLSNDIDTAGVFILEAEIELPYCEENDDEEDDDEEDDDEGDGEADREADFVVVQAFYADSNAIANELFVFVFGLDKDNDMFWSFGDEGSSTGPFPTWECETNGPYELCLTVGNGEEGCSDTYCFTLSLDSLGWLGGIQDGFSITVFDGDQGTVAGLNGLDLDEETLTLFPNPSMGGAAQLEWHAVNAGPAKVEVFDLRGRQLMNNQINVTQGTQRIALEVNAKPGIHLVKMTQGEVQRTLTWLVK